MHIYGHPLSSCTRKVFVALAEKGADATLRPVDLLAHAQHQPEHLALHPFAKVPVMDDDGFVLYEACAIVRYVDARFPGPCLVPADPRARALMDQWLSVDQSYVKPHTKTLVAERVVKKHRGQAPDLEATRDAEAGLAKAFGVLDAALRDEPFLTGPTFSLADVSLVPYVASLPMVGAEALLERLPRLTDWWQRVSSRPSWKRASSLA